MSRAVTRSPFASRNPSKRVIAALEMVMRLEDEAATLEDLLLTCPSMDEKRVLIARLRATKSSMKSWQDYYNRKAPYVKGASINPREPA